MKPEDVPLLFAEMASTFEPILGQPTDSDIVNITEILIEALYQIPFDDEKGVHNLVGIILAKPVYLADYKEPFPVQKKPGIYDPSITEDTKDSLRSQKEAIWKAKRRDYAFFSESERAVRKFIIAVVQDTYIRDLRSAKHFYTNVKPMDMLAHLQSMCGGLHALDVLALQDQMHNAHKDSEGIPEYINTLEAGRDKAERAGAPITDNMLVIIATKAMLTTEQYPRANETWEELDVVEKTWEAWKTLYRKAAKKAAIKATAASGRDQFGAAHAATESQSEDMNPHMGAAMGATMEGYFDNLAAAAMNDQSTLAEMVRAMSNLTESNEVLTKTNAALTHQLTVLQKSNGPNNPRNNPRNPRAPGVGPPKERKLCPHCKIEVFHPPSDCFELPANAAKRPASWVSKV